MLKDLKDRVAIITGASSGIGLATCKALAEEGANIVLASRSEEKLMKYSKELQNKYDVDTKVVKTDVREEKEVKNLIDETVDSFGKIDIVVNNAGLGVGSDIREMSTEDYMLMMGTNCNGMFFVTREALPYLEKTEGHLVFLGSFAGQYPRPFNPVYAATKWWTRGFALSVEAAEGENGISVTIINPSEVRTEFGSEDGESMKDRYDEKEVTEPQEVADAIVFAVKQDNSTTSEIDVYRKDKLSNF